MKLSALLLAFYLSRIPMAHSQLSGEVSLGGSSAAQAQEEKQGGLQTKQITVTGVGESPQAAEKQAITDAVRQAVGAYIDANTLVQNEEVVRDRILSVSNGFVKEYKATAPARKRDDGLYEITIIATVETNQVVQALKEMNLISGDVAGQNLWAEASTKVMNAQDAVAMLQAKIPEFIKTGVTITPLNKDGLPMVVKDASGKEIPSTAPAIVEEDASTGQATLTWFLEMGVDKKYYKETMFPLVKKCFDAISGVPPEDLITTTGEGCYIQDSISLWDNRNNKEMKGRQLNGTVTNKRSDILASQSVFYLVKTLSKSLDTVEALIYPQSKNCLGVKFNNEGRLAKITLKLLESDKEILGSTQITAWQPFATSLMGGDAITMVGPAVYTERSLSHLKLQYPIVQRVSIKLPIDMLKEVKKVDISIEPISFKLELRKIK